MRSDTIDGSLKRLVESAMDRHTPVPDSHVHVSVSDGTRSRWLGRSADVYHHNSYQTASHGCDMVQPDDSETESSFLARFHSHLRRWLPLIRMAFAFETSLFVLSVLTLLVVKSGSEASVILVFNLLILGPVLLLTGAILYLVDPLPAPQEGL